MTKAVVRGAAHTRPDLSGNGSLGARRMRRPGCCFDGRAGVPPAAGARMREGEGTRAAPDALPWKRRLLVAQR